MGPFRNNCIDCDSAYAILMNRKNHWLLQLSFCRRRHQPRRPALAKIRAGRPACGDGTGNWCGGIDNDDARKVARDRIVVMEESRHKKSLENRRKIKEAQCPGACV